MTEKNQTLCNTFNPKKNKMFRVVDRIQSLGAFQNVSKTALINRLIGLKLLKGVDFQKNKIKEY